MKIITSNDAAHVVKPEGTEVWYYLFDGYEVHYNEQAPGTTQTWHHHERIWEVVYILEGELVAKWKEGERVRQRVVGKGDIVESERSVHTYTNKTDKVVRFLVLKLVLDGVNHRELLKSDKVVDE